MANLDLRIIWEESDGGKSKALRGVDTTFSGVKQVLCASGKRFSDFNALITGAKVVTGMPVSYILWCSGMGEIFQGLTDNGLCREIC